MIKMIAPLVFGLLFCAAALMAGGQVDLRLSR